MSNTTDLSKFKSQLTLKNRMLRAVWGIVWIFLFRPSPRIVFAWRRLLLRVFGAKVGQNVRVYNSAQIYYPPNLRLGANVIIGPHVDLYCVDQITIQDNSMISQYSFLCTATHDADDPRLPLVTKPIVVEPQAWVCAAAFLGPGVTVGQGAVVGARASVFNQVESWTIVGGNPARKIRDRRLRPEFSEPPEIAESG